MKKGRKKKITVRYDVWVGSTVENILRRKDAKLPCNWKLEVPKRTLQQPKGTDNQKPIERKERQTHKYRNTRFLATFHNLLIPRKIWSDKNNLRIPLLIRIFHQFHHIWSTAPFLTVPETQSFRLDILMDQIRYRWPKRLFLIAADPDEVPVWTLKTCGECGAKTSTSTDANAALI